MCCAQADAKRAAVAELTNAAAETLSLTLKQIAEKLSTGEFKTISSPSGALAVVTKSVQVNPLFATQKVLLNIKIPAGIKPAYLYSASGLYRS
jgi:hypothetical protein